jgi:hypothetical protein
MTDVLNSVASSINASPWSVRVDTPTVTAEGTDNALGEVTFRTASGAVYYLTLIEVPS